MYNDREMVDGSNVELIDFYKFSRTVCSLVENTLEKEVRLSGTCIIPEFAPPGGRSEHFKRLMEEQQKATVTSLMGRLFLRMFPKEKGRKPEGSAL